MGRPAQSRRSGLGEWAAASPTAKGRIRGGVAPTPPPCPYRASRGHLGRGGLLALDHMAQACVESNQHRGGQQKTAQEARGR